jgi:hypothetical protein
MIELTLFRKDNGPLTKRIWLDADGSVKCDGSQCVMGRGRAFRIELDNLQALAAGLETFKSYEAIATGTLRPDLPDQVEVVTKRGEATGRHRQNAGIHRLSPWCGLSRAGRLRSQGHAAGDRLAARED